MDPKQFKAMIRRRMPYSTIVVQCDEDTTPEHLRAQGMVCAIVTWVPPNETAEFHNGSDEPEPEPEPEPTPQPKGRPYKEPPLADQPANDPPGDDDDPNRTED